jgi:predicted choloylglycine hydrolase
MPNGLVFEAIEELEPGPAWASLFAAHWPRYRAWFLADGEPARPSYAESARALREHLPELVPLYERLCELAGGGDVEARFLSMWAPPSYLAGCSQAVWQGAAGPILARNYDYAPDRLEGAILHTRWCGRNVIGTSDCAWGLLDGINDAGLAVSLAFGGRRAIGDGFGVPLIVRYLLQTCETTEAARKALRRLPYHLCHTLTIVDADGDVATAYLAPDREVRLSTVAVATNHQGRVEWAEHAAATRTVEREQCLVRLLSRTSTSAQQFVDAFLRPPLLLRDCEHGLATLYTAVYDVRARAAEFRWPGETWRQGIFEFAAGSRRIGVLEHDAA